jgi:fumarate hydratase class II
MPGKVNPVVCEAVRQVSAQVIGNDAAVAFAGSQGNFQLNVYKPVMLQGTLESIELLADAIDSFDQRCAQGIEPVLPKIRENLQQSLMLVTALNPHIGYENAAKIAQTAHREHSTLREAALKLGLVSAEDFDRWVDPAAMTRPG